MMQRNNQNPNKDAKISQNTFNNFMFIENHQELCCFSNHNLAGYDVCGTNDDVQILENKKSISNKDIDDTEHLKQKANFHFINHINIAKKIYGNDFKMIRILKILSKLNRDLTDWIDFAKIFYITILGNEEVFAKFISHGYTLYELEKTTEYIIQLADLLERNRLNNNRIV